MVQGRAASVVASCLAGHTHASSSWFCLRSIRLQLVCCSSCTLALPSMHAPVPATFLRAPQSTPYLLCMSLYLLCMSLYLLCMSLYLHHPCTTLYLRRVLMVPPCLCRCEPALCSAPSSQQQACPLPSSCLCYHLSAPVLCRVTIVPPCLCQCGPAPLMLYAYLNPNLLCLPHCCPYTHSVLMVPRCLCQCGPAPCSAPSSQQQACPSPSSSGRPCSCTLCSCTNTLSYRLFLYTLPLQGPDGAPVPVSVWTSTLQRTILTAAGLPFAKLKWKALDEIDAGICDGMTYAGVSICKRR